MKAEIKAATVRQEASETLGIKEKKLYYLLIEGERGGRLQLNIGEGTYEKIMKMKNEETLELREKNINKK